MTMRESFEVISSNFLVRGLLPEWVFRLPFEGLRKIKLAGEFLASDLRSKISSRRLSSKEGLSSEEEADIFGRLLRASDSEAQTPGQGHGLSDDELLSNTFMILFAGHETSSKALSITLGLLACEQEEQGRLYKVVKEVVPDDRVPTFEDYDALIPLRNAVLEALRLFPVGPVLFRQAYEDTTLSVPGLPHPLPVEKGTIFIGDFIGAGWSESNYPSPERYDPSRWPTSPSALLPDTPIFGLGQHVCLGRRFALYETVCLLAMFLREWKVYPGEMREGERPGEWRKRMMEDGLALGVTIGPGVVPVRLERRV